MTESPDLDRAIGLILQAARSDESFRAAWQRDPAQAIQLLMLAPSIERQLLNAIRLAGVPPAQSLAWLRSAGLGKNDFK